ncbi:dissimilatory sulfite reductase beta subunit [Magnetococcus marinus MC-1]|uniref:Dissimilatory sulfite reductase beta subunit n=1 Tax=Magnetococcus marinus (strain ATCC BAA-1437 / JCM 17883 / MC-1) TaxID=156889 RepID=A0L9L5_MAGMM|nr:dissimilatory-type sulfite reductase subunit beta [Magnetococcus marinus]ABK44658.1 dissimilatory sulfite reductase beta subunit [Magnetococcus marinus MC-1]
MAKREYQTVESGPHTYWDMLHPTIQKNYGQWKYHDRPRPGVLHHVSHTGDEVWTVKAGTHRQVTVDIARRLCDIADTYCDGFLRWTVRNNVEMTTDKEANVEPLIKALEAAGHPVGGTGNSITSMAHTQGWLHCDIPATDASGVVKSIMDLVYDEFKREEMPNRVKLSTSCCEINCGGQADIAIVVQHTRPPRINHDILASTCEMPSTVARCPVAAIRPTKVNGKPSLMVVEEKCICCGACFGACPAMEINHPEYSKLAIWIGGKNANTRSRPTNMKLVAHGLPNNTARWPEVAEKVLTIIKAYKEGGRDWERVGEWAERIGWKKFFEVTGLPFDKYMIDNYRHARNSFNQSAHIRF